MPEPYYAIIDGEPKEFKYENTHIARCAENPNYSAIVQTIQDENGHVTGGDCIYDQPEVMDDLEAQGFSVVDEDLAEAKENYHLYHRLGNEQAKLN